MMKSILTNPSFLQFTISTDGHYIQLPVRLLMSLVLLFKLKINSFYISTDFNIYSPVPIFDCNVITEV